MPYIGQAPTQSSFVVDTFNGTGSQTVFTMSVAPAGTTSVLVAISGVLQDPSTYSVSGTTLTFSAAPPSGTANISARYLGIPASGVTTTAYRTVTTFTATAGQTTFTPPSYTAGFINVYRSGVLLTPTSDYTATNGTTVVLASGATAGDTVIVESFLVSSVLNAIPNTPGSVVWNNLPTGSVLQVVSSNTTTGTSSTTSASFVSSGFSLSITPKFATSKILVIASFNHNGSGTNPNVLSTLYRNSTNILNTTSGNQLYLNTGSNILIPVTLTNLDSPATTSSTTYSIYHLAVAGTSIINTYYGAVNLTLMEIAG
ncbi:hypothetical protein UFOVP192_38 [uncultured Caudovirales phage]|uniref:Bacteriophage lambda, Stf, side tail fibre-repeat-2 n=1 Tax=uncultured Caudovirales phage TaxID=2100421 RepID=A0A6J7WFN2_9CAUD|nr:hypothetical protein UFOVP192_38 [uncultured Caudovirales phage]